MEIETLLLFSLMVVEFICLIFLLIVRMPKKGFYNILKITNIGNIFIIPLSLLISKFLGTAYFVIFMGYVILHILSLIYTYIFMVGFIFYEIGKGGGIKSISG